MKAPGDAVVLKHLLFPARRTGTHKERLASFYDPQAAHYDSFRERLLPGRKEMIDSIPATAFRAGVWIDIGCGTGMNLEFARPRIGEELEIVALDLTASLLEIASARISSLSLGRQAWTCLADAADLGQLGVRPTLATFSYSLSMIPRWWRVISELHRLMPEGGIVALVDFQVAPSYEPVGRRKHSWLARNFWRTWFDVDGVRLSPDHLAFLAEKFRPLDIHESEHRLPYTGFLRAPYYRFVGIKD